MGLHTVIKHHVTCDRVTCGHSERARITLIDMVHIPKAEHYFAPSGWVFYDDRWLCPTHAKLEMLDHLPADEATSRALEEQND